MTGLRLYMANGDPGADPVKYQISGRLLPPSSILNKSDNRCWGISSDYWLTAGNVCSTSDIRQRLYMNTKGEIRVLSHPGFCLNALYGYYYKRHRFTLCYSDDGDEYSDSSLVQKFIYNPTTGQLRNENAYIGTTCAYQTKGTVAQRKCDGSLNQKFAFNAGFSEWNLISEGNLPWISEYNRNPVGVQLSSTYEDGDQSHYFVQIVFYNNTTPYDEYKILFPETRDPESPMIEFAEIELPGMLLGQAT